MSQSIRRYNLTNQLLVQLGATGISIGDAEAPENSGWNDDPNSPGAEFTPYVVLFALPSSRSAGQFDNSQDIWSLPFKLLSAGGARQQADWVADKALDVIDGLNKFVYDLGAVGRWKVMSTNILTLDGPARLDLTEPPYWQRGDTVTIQLTKEL